MFSTAYIAKELLPALKMNKPESFSRHVQGIQYENIKIQTPDKADLDTVILEPFHIQNRPTKDKTFIIKFCGNYNCYEEFIDEYAEDAKALDATIVGFNYRGVGNSTKNPERFRDLVTDGITQVQRLLDNKASSNNIIIHGYSIGGAVATKVAEYFSNKNITLTLINERSFSSLSAAAEGILRNNLTGLLAQLPSSIRIFGISTALQYLEWEVDVVEAFLKHPKDRKLLLAIFPDNWSGGKFGDGVIPHDASLITKVEKTNAHSKQNCILLDTKNSPNQIGHALRLTQLFNKENMEQSGKQVVNNFIQTRVNSLTN